MTRTFLDGDGRRALLEMTDHVRGTEHILAGLLPDYPPSGG